jgi:amino acid transporter
MVSATFAYLGTELVGVTVGEAQNPRRTIPRAIKLTFWRILVFYVLSVLLVGTLVPYNDKKLAFAIGASSSAAASPFVVAIELSGIPVLSHIINACILLFVFSAANSDLYIATRTIYGLARENKAPKILARTDRRGVPVFALGISSVFALLAYMNVTSDSKVVFKYFVNLVTIFGLLTWISILVTHICFVRARKAQNVPVESLAYVAPLGVAGSYAALAFCILIALTKNYDVFTHNKKWGDFDYKNFITAYLGIPLYLIMITGYKLVTKCKGVDPATADLWTGKDEIDREEAAFIAKRDAEIEKHAQSHWFYQKFVSWLF